MDCEPGRCRRTDGRKWRCSKSVIPGQKYCEGHMHRGRQGSRKRVEPKDPVAKSDNNKILDDNRTPVAPLVNRVNVSDKGHPNPVQNCCNNGKDDVNATIVDKSCDALAVANPTIVDRSCDALLVADSAILGLEVNKNDHGDHTITAMGTNTINNSATYDTDGNKSGFGNVNPTKISRRKPSVTRNSYHGFVTPTFGLSPKSVLHSGPVVGKPGLDLDRKTVAETEQRCRRTDGKKWQCRRDTVPGQKYCEAHMHRGAKRVMLNQESASNFPRSAAHISETIAGHADDRINLNTMPTSPHCTTGNNSTSSTSDSTTVTDENIGFCLKHQKG